MKLLIVDDDEAMLQMYSDNICFINKKLTDKIEVKITKNLSEAKESLLSPEFDAAIVDLKLSSTSTELEGLEIVNEIKNKLRFPVFIVSGSIAQLTEEESAFLKLRSRDVDFQSILQEITSIYDTGITKILGKKGKIDDYLNCIFWKNLSNSIKLWIDDTTRTAEEKQDSLLRVTIMHMQEYIDEQLEKYHPSEFYIIKPIKENIFTGDIIECKDGHFIVLTPACDITKRLNGIRNAEFVFVCKIKALNEIVKNFDQLDAQTVKNNENRKRLEGYFNNKNQRYHFTPKSFGISPGLIDFQDKTTIPCSVIEDSIKEKKMERIATVAHPFLKDIISRFSTYYARQGSPDLDVDELYKSLF